MNEYLENLKNTQGKTKTPPRLTSILPKLGFNIMRDSPDIPSESVNNADDMKCEKKIARDFVKYGAFHKVDKGHNLNDSQESLSDLSDSENESNDKLEPLCERSDYIPQRIKEGRRSTSMSQRQQLFDSDRNELDLTGDDHNIITEESISTTDVITDDKSESVSVRRTSVYSRRSVSCQRSTDSDISKSSKLEFSLLKPKQEDPKEPNQLKQIIFLVLVLLAFVCAYLLIWSVPSSERNNKWSSYTESFVNLKAKYPNQTKLFWANIQSCYMHSILKSKDPSIILIVSDNTTGNLGDTLANDILSMVHSSVEANNHNLNQMIISPHSDQELASLISGDKRDQVKLHIDTKLNRIFMNKKRIALVKDIQEIPATSMLLFYTYGDDLLSAKYPGIVILMTLKLDDVLDNEKDKNFRNKLHESQNKLTSYVEDYLFKLWSKEVGDDQLRPLFTRIANNVVLVNNE